MLSKCKKRKDGGWGEGEGMRVSTCKRENKIVQKAKMISVLLHKKVTTFSNSRANIVKSSSYSKSLYFYNK